MAFLRSQPKFSLLKRSRVIFDKRERVCILGSGWAGYNLLSELDSDKYAVSLVSPRNHFLFTPLLASAAVGGSTIESVCQPIRPLASQKGARFYEARATSLDKAKQVVTCQTLDGAEFPLKYDKLVIACGFQANDFGIPDLEKRAFFMKETGDARRLHDHVLRCFEEASFIHLLDGDEHLSSEEEKMIRQVLSFVIVGAGPTGTELCGELTDFLHNEVRTEYPHLAQFWSVKLLDAAPVVLGPFQNKDLQEHARNHLEQNQGVGVHLNEFVDKVEDNAITMKSGNVYHYSTLVWCAGIKPLPFVAGLGLTMNDRNSQILTDRALKVKNESTGKIWAIGDCATIENFWLPQTAQIANQQANYLANALNSDDIEGYQKETQFQNEDKGTLAYIGGTAALYRAPGPLPNLTGFLGWFTWKSAYWHMQLSNRNRVMLGVNWVFNYFFGRDLTRVGTYSHPASGLVNNEQAEADMQRTASFPGPMAKMAAREQLAKDAVKAEEKLAEKK